MLYDMDRRQTMLLGAVCCCGGAGLIGMGLGSAHALFFWLGGIAAFVVALVLFVRGSGRRQAQAADDPLPRRPGPA